MSGKRIIVFFICFSFLCALMHPMAYASENLSAASVEVTDDYAVYRYEDSEKVYNIVIFMEQNQGQFAIKYKESKDIVYEYIFNLPFAKNTDAADYWDTITELCFKNEDNWTAINLTTAITCVSAGLDGTNGNARDYAVDYFESWIEEKNGSAITDLYFSSQTFDGITFSRYFSRVHHAYVNQWFAIQQSMSLTSFILSVLGYNPDETLISTLSVVIGGTQLASGSVVTKYTLRTIECYYITANGGDYPYSIADRYTYYSGYKYSETGTCNVDGASRRIVYDPSENYYLAATVQFNTAYQEYLDIGWQG